MTGLCVAPPASAQSLFSVTFSNNRINEQNPNGGALLNSYAPPVPAQGGGGVGLAASSSALYYSTIDNANIWRLNPANGVTLGVFPRPAAATNGIDALGFGSLITFGDTLFAQDFTNNVMYLLNPTTGSTYSLFTMPFDAVGGIDFDSSTNLLWVTASDGFLRGLDPFTGTVIRSLNLHSPEAGVGVVNGRLFTSAGLTIEERDKTTGGVINSFGSPNGATVGALAGAVIPEPATLALLPLAAAALARRRHRR